MVCNESSYFYQAISHALQRHATPSNSSQAQAKSKYQGSYEGKDAFVWLPTRFGKSVCYMKPYHLCSILSSERMHLAWLW